MCVKGLTSINTHQRKTNISKIKSIFAHTVDLIKWSLKAPHNKKFLIDIFNHIEIISYQQGLDNLIIR